MSKKGNRIRQKLKSIYQATVASTADRDTKCNDLQAKYKVSNGYLIAHWKTMSADIQA